jgi:hypothetical protein
LIHYKDNIVIVFILYFALYIGMFGITFATGRVGWLDRCQRVAGFNRFHSTSWGVWQDVPLPLVPAHTDPIIFDLYYFREAENALDK